MEKKLQASMIESNALILETRKMLDEIERDVMEVLAEEQKFAERREQYFKEHTNYLATPISGNLFAKNKKRIKFNKEKMVQAFEEISSQVEKEVTGVELASSRKVYHKYYDKIVRHCYFIFEEFPDREYLLLKSMTFDFLHKIILNDLMD